MLNNKPVRNTSSSNNAISTQKSPKLLVPSACEEGRSIGIERSGRWAGWVKNGRELKYIWYSVMSEPNIGKEYQTHDQELPRRRPMDWSARALNAVGDKSRSSRPHPTQRSVTVTATLLPWSGKCI